MLKTYMNAEKQKRIVNDLINNYKFPNILHLQILLVSIVFIFWIWIFLTSPNQSLSANIYTGIFAVPLTLAAWFLYGHILMRKMRHIFLKVHFDPENFYFLTEPKSIDVDQLAPENRKFGTAFNQAKKQILTKPAENNYELMLETDEVYFLLSRAKQRKAIFRQPYMLTIIDKSPENMAIIKNTDNFRKMLAPYLEKYIRAKTKLSDDTNSPNRG
ncbi:hypothetical protein FC83_GL000176 [Agrilactobacillus composti DSM 18527 = JCM 14202]|uniref:Uncharacterized protein n=1 Tax=Agrilactobacillus composti DSM 18527 = JCM 14202 TaxID=1423734 RepID=X0PDI8_9LACO|nr:hypothetical protein [Agrilactobacillus composti]KRM32890.1 hypothetical protein FC83_GL000176 [Agrilactobacillus composti DSM 18527 = JCM 14202]GAF39204.1 hypothetical protein JCM14202_1049 [Agrilactobacillus composti DSM 18527 = JCM 14202]